jgi:hypothetical protein
MTLADVDRFIVPSRVIVETEEELRRAGARGHELFVLWTGRVDGDAFDVRTSHVPRQSSYRLPEGLLVRVEADALHQLNSWLYDHGEMLGVQVHAHPDAAYHSETDSTYPIVTTLGGLSLVAERFCAGDLLSRSSAAYRLTRRGWKRLAARRLVRTICVRD